MKTDCFAYNSRSGMCTALTVCACEGCKFYKTASEAKASRQEAFEALKKKDTFLYFKDKYNIRVS